MYCVCIVNLTSFLSNVQCLYRQLEMDRDEAYVLAGNTMVDNLKLDDGKEGIDAFVEKRKPVWKD